MDNNYKYIKNISSGAFSNVGLYKNKNKYYAIKISNDDENFEGILCNELREIISLIILRKHPNIIDISEIFLSSDSTLNLVYKFYPETLDSYLQRTTIDDRINYTLPFIAQMLSILHFLDINQIIHSDIKPHNILVYFKNDELVLKLIDFGSCHIEGLTSKYSIVTTYTHRAPEVFSYNKNYDFKIDIWSFGVILFKFITGIDIIDYKIHNKTDDLDKLKDIYKFIGFFLNYNMDLRLKLFLSKIFTIDPLERYNINQLGNLFNDIFNVTFLKYKRSCISYSINLLDEKLNEINKYISERMFNVNLDNLNFGNLIISKLEDLTDLDYVTIWYLNYQFCHSDAEYILKDFIYIFNSFYKKIFNKADIHNNCFTILYLIDFNLF
jgi:serine/threonine protein kinase